MTNVAEKVRKLLRLSTSANENEAAVAAAKAQQLIDEHSLSVAALALDDDADTQPNEDIEDFGRKGAPLDEGKQLDRWRWALAVPILQANGCKGYARGGDLHIVGRASDADAVRYLYAYLKREVDALTEKNAKGCGRTWANNYRLGIIDTIGRKLRAERERFRDEMREHASRTGGVALVRLNQALAIVDARGAEVERWAKKHMRLRRGSSSNARYHHGARQQGRTDGKAIHVNGARGSVGAGTRRIGSGS